MPSLHRPPLAAQSTVSQHVVVPPVRVAPLRQPAVRPSSAINAASGGDRLVSKPKPERQSTQADAVKTQAELLLEDLERDSSAAATGAAGDDEEEDAAAQMQHSLQMQERLDGLKAQAQQLSQQIDALYNECFVHLSVDLSELRQQQQQQAGATSEAAPQEGELQAAAAAAGEAADDEPVLLVIESMTEARFGAMGREQPEVLNALLSAKQTADPEGWARFQAEVRPLKLQRTRVEREAGEVADALQQAAQRAASRAAAAARSAAMGIGSAPAEAAPGTKTARVVLLTGFESFNQDLYKQAAARIRAVAPHIKLEVFSDRELSTAASKARVETALASADVFFGSLLFDYDQVEWLRERIQHIPVRLVFESALELMACTQAGGFSMGSSTPGQKQGPPPVVKKVLGLFGSQREEDKMVGYLSFLKIGPKLLKFVPGKKAADLRHWLTIYSYWNQGGLSNVVSMVLYLVDTYVSPLPKAPASSAGVVAASLIGPPVETPPLGCLHPAYQQGRAYFTSPAQYWAWYQKEGPLRSTRAPVVAVLLYRKHVITEQPYILQLITTLEQEGVIPVPVFINGVEAHTVVRDLLTTSTEQASLARGASGGISPTLARDAVRVDAVVSTIGFPLVGGPAGSMEGGRQADVAKTILTTKNIPYVVAAPLLIQDMASWMRDGVAGLQSVVLYGLPELDGAIDTVPLGGLVGDSIYLVPERVRKVAGRLKAWVNLRRKPVHERRVAILLYGFPPGVGAVGTAALLNVPKSLESLLHNMKAAGYNLGNVDVSALSGEAVVAALAQQDQQRAVAKGANGVEALGAGEAGEAGVQAVAAEVMPHQLKEWLTYPPEWGPTEWGPIPFLPDHDVLVHNMEKQWGELRKYRGIMSSSTGGLVVPGLRAGNVFVGVQPVLGLEGDPMRLLFERDLTPHPQYAAFYKWLQHELEADVVLHLGMHGTVEWLPGAPLGNTGLSWSDVLLGELPNVYVYACNNPSESIIAKRRGYGTIISHNVPPYGRAGLYKQLATLKEMISEWRVAQASGAGKAAAALQQQEVEAAAAGGDEQLQPHEGEGGDASQRSAIYSNIQLVGLEEDVAFFPAPDSHLWQVAAEEEHKAAEAAAQAAEKQAVLSGLGKRSPTASRGGSPIPPPIRRPGSPRPTRSAAQSMTRYSHAAEAAGARTSRPASPAAAPSMTLAGASGSSSGGSAGRAGAARPEGSLALTDALVAAMSAQEWSQYMSDVYAYLQVLENRLFSEGLHVLGAPPSRSGMVAYLDAYFDNTLPTSALEAVADAASGQDGKAVKAQLERACMQLAQQASSSAPRTSNGSVAAPTDDDPAARAQALRAFLSSPEAEQQLDAALNIRDLLNQNTEEMRSLLRGLGGEYILPEAGGDLLRDGAGVLPTGRNIHALDPYRMPSPAALERGSAAAQAVIDAHRAANGGAYPETVAINLWGLDAIKTKGESVGMVLHMVGAAPVREGTGRIARYALLPLEELGGRPRVDVLCNMSGIFRDSFQNVVELLDDLFQRAADADEPPEMNFIRKHAQAMSSQGVDNAAARLFSNPAGDYGSMVNERVGTGQWENGDELGDTWASRNAFSYGRGGERGTARPEVLKGLLSTTSRIVQQVDSVEYGLTDIQEYYANTGALARAAQTAQGGARVGVSIVEAFSKDPAPRELDQVLRLEYRSKLLNPKWAQAMAAQGSGGAYEISQRMTAMVGWGATSGFQENWVWDQAADTYALDPEMSEKLRKANPQAFSNVLKRMLEAAGRGMWKPSHKQLEQLRRMYSEMDDELEGVTKGGKTGATAAAAKK